MPTRGLSNQRLLLARLASFLARFARGHHLAAQKNRKVVRWHQFEWGGRTSTSARTVRTAAFEVFILVLGILIAFGLDSWWTGRAETQWEEAQLGALLTEFEANLAHTLRVEGVHNNNADQLTALREWADSVPPGSKEPFPAQQAVHLITWRTSEFSLGALDALLSSGDLGRLQSTALRRELIGWKALLQDVQEKETLAQTFVEQVLTPSLLGQGFLSDAYDARPPYGDASVREDIVIIASPELVDLLSARIGHSRMAAASQANLRDASTRILSLIRGE